jgi:hypothetical protein
VIIDNGDITNRSSADGLNMQKKIYIVKWECMHKYDIRLQKCARAHGMRSLEVGSLPGKRKSRIEIESGWPKTHSIYIMCNGTQKIYKQQKTFLSKEGNM